MKNLTFGGIIDLSAETPLTGELDKACEGILVGLANGRHLAQTPFYINQLVALSIHQVMLDRTAELISQPDSPNLYWALSTLPDSLPLPGRAFNRQTSCGEKLVCT